MVVCSVALLLPGIGSAISFVAVAVLVIIPLVPLLTLTCIRMVAVCPTAIVGKSQLYSGGLLLLGGGVDETKVTLEGSVSLT